MVNFREVNDDILKEWLEFREENILCYLTEEDKKHKLFIDEIYEKVLKNVPQQNKKYTHSYKYKNLRVSVFLLTINTIFYYLHTINKTIPIILFIPVT